MPKIIVEESKDFLLLPPDSILSLKIDEVSTKLIESGRHGPWEKLEFKFKILGIQAVGDGTPVDKYDGVIASPIWGSVPFKLTDSPENRLRQWTEAILGLEIGVGYELDTDLFLGREVRGITSQYEKRARDARGNAMKAHQIDSLLPKGGSIPAAAPVAATAAPVAAAVAPAWEEAPF